MSIDVFEQRILPMKDKLFRFALHLIQHVQEAEDIVQEVMLKIWSKREEWPQWKSMEAYCMTATRNNCLDRIRKKGPSSVHEQQVLHIGSREKDPYELITGKEMLNQIKKCMQTLPEHQQLVIRLREMEGFSYNEIAEVLDMSLEQVKVNLFRARTAIKKSISNDESA